MYAQGYADDIVILIRGKHMGTCLEIMQRALSIVERLCVTEGLSVNPSKTIMVPFTKQRNAKITRAPLLFGNQIEVAREVKYLAIKLDDKLTWNSHIESITSRSQITLITMRRAIGCTWDLTPSMAISKSIKSHECISQTTYKVSEVIAKRMEQVIVKFESTAVKLEENLLINRLQIIEDKHLEVDREILVLKDKFDQIEQITLRCKNVVCMGFGQVDICIPHVPFHSVTINFTIAVEHLDKLKDTIEKFRTDEHFRVVLSKASHLGQSLGVEDNFPIEGDIRRRKKKKQFDYEAKDENISCPENNFRINFFFAVLDTTIKLYQKEGSNLRLT
nr:unnamed protein product [Callosobruchus chinensis]